MCEPRHLCSATKFDSKWCLLSLTNIAPTAILSHAFHMFDSNQNVIICADLFRSDVSAWLAKSNPSFVLVAVQQGKWVLGIGWPWFRPQSTANLFGLNQWSPCLMIHFSPQSFSFSLFPSLCPSEHFISTNSSPLYLYTLSISPCYFLAVIMWPCFGNVALKNWSYSHAQAHMASCWLWKLSHSVGTCSSVSPSKGR